MKAVSYARFSSDNQREESITAQLRAIREYADREGITIIREYIDEARSATTDDRPGFLSMIRDLKNGLKVDLVLVHKLDRFARNRYDAAVYRREIQRAGARLVAVTQPLDDSPESVILEAMLEAMAEYYSRNLGREVMKGMRETAYQGRHTGGKPPLGYDIDPGTKKYVVNEGEAEVVRLIFRMVAEGYGYGEILRALNERGARTKRGQLFGKNSIHDILRNEKYVGIYVFNRAASAQMGRRNNHANKPDDEIVRLPGEVPAIIDLEIWKRVRAIMNSRKMGVAPKRKGEVHYFLTGLVYCGECGAAMTGHTATGGRNKIRYHFYACNSKRRQKTCKNPDIRKEVLEDFVLDEIEKLFLPGQAEELATRLEEHYRKQKSTSDIERKQVITALEDIRQRMDKLFDALETGQMAADIAGPRLNALGAEKEALEARLREIESRDAIELTRDRILAYLRTQQNIIADRTDTNACRRLVEAYVEKIIVRREDVEVVLKFSPGSPNTGGGGPYVTIGETTSRRQVYRSYSHPDYTPILRRQQ